MISGGQWGMNHQSAHLQGLEGLSLRGHTVVSTAHQQISPAFLFLLADWFPLILRATTRSSRTHVAFGSVSCHLLPAHLSCLVAPCHYQPYTELLPIPVRNY